MAQAWEELWRLCVNSKLATPVACDKFASTSAMKRVSVSLVDKGHARL